MGNGLPSLEVTQDCRDHTVREMRERTNARDARGHKEVYKSLLKLMETLEKTLGELPTTLDVIIHGRKNKIGKWKDLRESISKLKGGAKKTSFPKIVMALEEERFALGGCPFHSLSYSSVQQTVKRTAS